MGLERTIPDVGLRVHPAGYMFQHATANGRLDAVGANEDVALRTRTIGEFEGERSAGGGLCRVRRHPLGAVCAAVLPQVVDECLNDGWTGEGKEAAFELNS